MLRQLNSFTENKLRLTYSFALSVLYISATTRQLIELAVVSLFVYTSLNQDCPRYQLYRVFADGCGYNEFIMLCCHKVN